MTRLIAFFLLSLSAFGQFGDPRWRVRAVGASAARPATCTANRDVFVCSGSGCSPNPSLEFCTAANTFTAFSGGGSGTVTSVDAGNGVETVSGSAITSTGTIRGAIAINAQTGTTYTVLTGDRGKLITHSNGSAIAVTLPQAGVSFPVGWFTYVQNLGAGTVTITPTTSTIDGVTSLALTTNQGTIIVSDGTNYFTMRGVGVAGSGTVTSVATTSPITGGTITGSGTIACATCVTSAASLTSNLPVIGGGGQATAVGTVQGNTTKFATYAGSAPATNDCAKFDASGNLTSAGAACGTSTGLGDPGSNGVVYRNGSGTSTTATATEMAGPLYCADAGANDAYACTLSPAPSGYTTGATYIFKANTLNTDAATINFNSLGAKTIKKVAGGITTDLTTNDIRAGQVVTLTYDGTNMQMQSTLGNAASGGGSSLTYGTYASLPGTCTTGDRYLTNDSIYEFACTATNTWTAFHRGRKVVIPPASGWSWNGNQGSATVDYTYGYGYLYAPANAGDSIRGQVRSATAPWTVTARFRWLMHTADFATIGLMVRDSATDKHVFFGIAANSGHRLYSYYHATATGSGTARGTSRLISNVDEIWLRIQDDNTNRILSYSLDGSTWIQYSSDVRTTDLTPDQVGWEANSNNSQRVDNMLISWQVE